MILSNLRITLIIAVGLAQIPVLAMDQPSGSGNRKRPRSAEAPNRPVHAEEDFESPHLTESIRHTDIVTLLKAAARGDAYRVRQMIKAFAPVNAVDDYNSTALHYASANGHIDAMTVLIEYSADVNALDNFYLSPLHQAVSRNQRAAVQLLLQHHATPDISDFDGWTALHTGISGGNVGIIHDLLAAGADINAPTPHNANSSPNTTPLQLAIGLSDGQPTIRELVRWGARIAVAQRPAIIQALERHPLILASARGDYESALGHITTTRTTINELIEAIIFAIGQRQGDVVELLANRIVQLAGPERLQSEPLHHVLALLRTQGFSQLEREQYEAIKEILDASMNQPKPTSPPNNANMAGSLNLHPTFATLLQLVNNCMAQSHVKPQ